MKIGVICPSEIALRRFMPALQQCDEFEFAGIGVYTKKERFGDGEIDESAFQVIHRKETEKAQVFVDRYGGKIYDGYEAIVASSEIEALYIPLPPALHYQWARAALENGKHVLVEKPSTTSALDSETLAKIANEKKLALHENYMFAFHKQLDAIEDIIHSGGIGDIRLYRISFGFPRRAVNDFRYNRVLGGGALLDAGGYTIKYATRLLGPTAKFTYAQSNYLDEFEVDMFGSAAMVNADGVTAQLAFGMDNNYKCELEAWGSKGCLTTGRVLTAPADFTPLAVIRKGNEDSVIQLPADDSFLKSVQHFVRCVKNDEARKRNYQVIVKQAELVDEFKSLAGWTATIA